MEALERVTRVMEAGGIPLARGRGVHGQGPVIVGVCAGARGKMKGSGGALGVRWALVLGAWPPGRTGECTLEGLWGDGTPDTLEDCLGARGGMVSSFIH